MAKVHKSIADARKHLAESVPNIPARYSEATARAEWAGPSTTDEAETNWVAGLNEAQARDTRRSKIREAGDTKYRAGCKEKGAGVIGTRITAALGIYEKNFSPVLSAMNSASDSAPPRTRDWRSNVANRLFPVVEAARRAAGKD